MEHVLELSDFEVEKKKGISLGQKIVDVLVGIAYQVTHPVAVRNGLANYVVDLLDVGAGGSLVFRTSAAAEVATCAFSATAFGGAVNGVATANAISNDADATGGTTDNFTAEASNADVAFAGSVGALSSGEDIELSSPTVNTDDQVAMSSLTYAAAA